jgi:hypothetical protein
MRTFPDHDMIQAPISQGRHLVEHFVEHLTEHLMEHLVEMTQWLTKNKDGEMTSRMVLEFRNDNGARFRSSHLAYDAPHKHLRLCETRDDSCPSTRSGSRRSTESVAYNGQTLFCVLVVGESRRCDRKQSLRASGESLGTPPNATTY